MSITDLIKGIFDQNTVEELQKEYAGAGILQQLLCIERSLKTYMDYMAERPGYETEMKRGGKLPEKLETNKRKKEERLKEIEREAKIQKEIQLNARLRRKKTRRDMSRNYIEEKHYESQEDNVDRSLEEYEKYFT
jgi:hypothetical protein